MIPTPTIVQLPPASAPPSTRASTRSQSAVLVIPEELEASGINNAAIQKLSNNYMITPRIEMSVEENFMQDYNSININNAFIQTPVTNKGQHNLSPEKANGDDNNKYYNDNNNNNSMGTAETEFSNNNYKELAKYLGNFAATVVLDPGKPNTAKEALIGPDAAKRAKAMVQEAGNFVCRDAWKPAKRDLVQKREHKPTSVKWVFKIKQEHNGS